MRGQIGSLDNGMVAEKNVVGIKSEPESCPNAPLGVTFRMARKTQHGNDAHEPRYPVIKRQTCTYQLLDAMALEIRLQQPIPMLDEPALSPESVNKPQVLPSMS